MSIFLRNGPESWLKSLEVDHSIDLFVSPHFGRRAQRSRDNVFLCNKDTLVTHGDTIENHRNRRLRRPWDHAVKSQSVTPSHHSASYFWRIVTNSSLPGTWGHNEQSTGCTRSGSTASLLFPSKTAGCAQVAIFLLWVLLTSLSTIHQNTKMIKSSKLLQQERNSQKIALEPFSFHWFCHFVLEEFADVLGIVLSKARSGAQIGRGKTINFFKQQKKTGWKNPTNNETVRNSSHFLFSPAVFPLFSPAEFVFRNSRGVYFKNLRSETRDSSGSESLFCIKACKKLDRKSEHTETSPLANRFSKALIWSERFSKKNTSVWVFPTPAESISQYLQWRFCTCANFWNSWNSWNLAEKCWGSNRWMSTWISKRLSTMTFANGPNGPNAPGISAPKNPCQVTTSERQ